MKRGQDQDQSKAAAAATAAVVIIGIAGYAHTGKDTVTRHLTELGFEQRAFADAVRRFALRLNVYFPQIGKRYKELVDEYGYEKCKEIFPFFREHLVDIGAGGRDCIDPLIWINAASRNLPSKVVFSDVRYANEADLVHELGGVVWLIERPGVGPPNDSEAKSIPLIKYDVKIQNGGTLAELKETVVHLWNKHRFLFPKANLV